MKKKKIEEIIGRLNVLIDENPRLICLNCAEAKELVKMINTLKSELDAYKVFMDKFQGVL